MVEIKRLVVKSGNIFDSNNGKMMSNKTIVIENKKITWVGDDSSFEKEKTDKIIDASNKTILPGLIETHVHLEMSGDPQYEREFLRTKDDMWHYYALNNAQKHLISGFTCVRDCGSTPGWAPALRRIFDYGILAGPRLLVADDAIVQWGNQEAVGPQCLLDYYKVTGEVQTGIDGVKHAVRDRKRAGADFIKTATTGGVLHGMESKLSMSLFTDEELVAMVEEAHRLDMHLASHAHGDSGIYCAAKAGIDTIEHGSFISEETANLLIKKETYLVPTQNAVKNLIKPEILKQMSLDVQEKILNTNERLKENHKMAFNKGVLFAIGTDAGTPGNFHGTTATEITNMVVNVGMLPEQALQTATIQSARAIKMAEKIGSIEPGKLADILICNTNPIKDITTLENPLNFSYVIKDGKIMVEKGKIVYFN
ncbi:MAG: amidohydrolase family protein [Candidatus Heimdallarchaeota archaeon]|nr:amidohydrolase family protein [Candidatus Heimdallarchaeota archaeon]